MDLFDDGEPSAPRARVKFQPKAKARVPPAKKASAAANPVPRQAAVNPPVAASPTKAIVPNNDSSDSADTSSAGAKVPNEAISIENTANLQTSSSADPLVFSMENVSAISGNMEENATSMDGINPCFHYGESTIESAEVFIGLDSVDDTVPQSTSVADATFDALNSHYEETLTDFPDHENEEQLSYKDSNAVDIEVKRGQLETKGGHASSSFELLDLMSEAGSAGKRASKFQPKIKQKRGKKKVAIESASDPRDTLVVPSEPQNSNQGSVDEGLNFPDVRVDPLSTENDYLLNEEEWLETSPDFTPDLPSCTDAATDCLLNQAAQLPQSPSGFAAEASDQLNVDEAANNNGHNEEEGGSKKRKPSSRSKKDANETRKYVRKRKKTAEAIEKSNNKTTDASEKSSEQPPKKFSRTTRRRNRCIDKKLLETPEDEIVYQSLPIKDLILLAEHRERKLAEGKKADTSQMVLPAKETTVEPEPMKNTSNNLWDDPYDEYDDMYNAAQAEGSFDGPSTSAVERDTTVFNYHSHMSRTPRVKWTKQDTELFYEAVREFGSDLSMINHLFPDRTRQQIKLKYKKEERQQPMKLLDALTNRTKEFSHYKLVIGRLQEKIDREEEELMAEGEGNEGNPEVTADDTQEQAPDEAAKSEQNGDGSGVVEDHGEVKVGSPTASNESEFDMGDWSEYKSDF